MEPRASIGVYGKEEDKLALRQQPGPNRVRQEIAHELFHMPENKLQVISRRRRRPGMKGGFYGEDVLVLWAARRNRPVKWTSDQRSFISDSHGRDVVADCEMAFDVNGLITAVRVSGDYNVGAYVAPSAVSLRCSLPFLCRVSCHPSHRRRPGTFTNTNGCSYRGAGRLRRICAGATG